jgi:putative serine protease PepD
MEILPEMEPERGGMKRIAGTFVTVVASMAIGGLIVGAIAWGFDDDDGAPAESTTTEDSAQPVSDEPEASGELPEDLSDLYEQMRPSVVRVTSGDSTPFGSEGFGSGVVIDDQGHIITNYHVVSGSDDVTITFADGSVVDGEVAGTDPGNDIALVKVAAGLDQLEPAALGDSDAVDVGSAVAALGNPFGLDGTFTTGVISGLDRTLPSSANGRPIRGLLQTDAAINPGNSGGALFNLEGEVIGINTAIESGGTGGFVGVGYAVPINTPKRFLTELVAGETIEHPRLGISGQPLTLDEADDRGVAYGVAVLAVDPGSAADEAGLEGSETGDGDVIVEIDGSPMRTFDALADYIDSKDVGDTVTLTVNRDGEQIELTATLKSWDSSA